MVTSEKNTKEDMIEKSQSLTCKSKKIIKTFV